MVEAKEESVEAMRGMTFRTELEQETDGRWIAEVLELPGVLAYGQTQGEVKAKVQVLARRVVAAVLSTERPVRIC